MAAEETHDPPKARIFGPYVLLKALGRGAMGDVNLARPVDPRRGIPTPVVVKRLHGELAHRKGFVARFRHEAAIAVAVDSPHVARVYDVGSVGDTLYICMDYVAGWPLSRVLDAILKSGHHASIASVVDLIAGGLEGLHALHTAVDPKTQKPLEIVHRDLSPKNLMVGEDGGMRLIDLGLGKSSAQDWRTRTGVVMGSVGYMPPEQARGERVDARADVYAMGVVAFEMLALRNFIRRGPLPKMMEASTAPAFVRPSEFRPDVPPELDLVIERALRPNKDDRYPSAKAFLDELRRAIPPSRAQGGMGALLNDLFGSTRQDREDEIRALLALPFDGDEFESKPTRVYGIRKGIIPPDLQPTQASLHPSRSSNVAVIPVTSIPDSTETEVAIVDVTAAPLVVSSQPFGPAGAREVPDTKPPVEEVVRVTASRHRLRPREGVSIGVLISSVIIATLVGAFVAVLIVRAVDEPNTTTIRAVAPPKPETPPRPSVSAGPVEVPTPAPPESPPPRIVRTKKRSAVARRVDKPPPLAAPPATPKDTQASLDSQIGRLLGALQAKKKTLPPEERTAINRLLLDLTRASRSKDLEVKRSTYQSVVAKAKTLD